MKKTLLLITAAATVCTTRLMADTDLFITGATAFRAQVHDACMKMFSPAPTEYTGTAATGGDSKTGNAAAQWTMTGTPIASLSTNISGTLTIHALFNGSIIGTASVESGTKLLFLDRNGNKMTNSATIAYSDASSASTPYPVSATTTYAEENVAIQPFVICKSVAGNGLTNVINISWEQLKYAIPAGRIPLASWTLKASDLTNYVYVVNRTKDSGTRRCFFAQFQYGFNQNANIYIYDPTNNVFYKTTSSINGAAGSQPANIGIVGAPGNANVNLNWGSGYVGGGDIKTELGLANPANQAIACLSFADAKGITGGNWTQVVPFGGIWPTAAGAGITSSTTNDFTPITLGSYGLWGAEVCIYPTVDPNTLPAGDQDLTATQLGTQTTAGTLLGVLNSQTKYNGGSPLLGSIEYEIEASKTVSPGATAIRLSDMTSSRGSVGGTIAP